MNLLMDSNSKNIALENSVGELQQIAANERVHRSIEIRKAARAVRERAVHQLALAQGRKNREIERVKAEFERLQRTRHHTRELIGHEIRRIDYERDRIQREVVRVDQQKERSMIDVERGKRITSYEKDRIAKEAGRIDQQKERLLVGIEREKRHISHEKTHIDKEKSRFLNYLSRFKIVNEASAPAPVKESVTVINY